MLRRNIWTYVSVAVPCIAIAFAGVTRSAVAQDKPADKPKADKPKADKPKDEPKKAEKDVVDLATGNKDLSTLVDLLKAADLVSTLKDKGPYTVFAPTNAAFDKLGKDKLEELKKDKAKLANVLKHHIASGSLTTADVSKAKTIKTLNGAELTVTGKDKEWMVDKAKITGTELKASNGVVHTIDTVCMPPATAPVK